MKIRQGFVSNSSSSSFVLDKNGMTEKQVEAIRNWVKNSINHEDTSINESNKHFYGTMSYHLDPCLVEVMKENEIDFKNLDTDDDDN